MFGSHLSIAGSMAQAIRGAEALGMDTVQVFTKNQQQWKAPPLAAAAIEEWLGELTRMGWRGRTVSHASYLINMGTPDDGLWEKSLGLMREEVLRCETLGIPFLVFHPGAHTTGTREEGIARIAKACGQILKETAGGTVTLCFENVAGAGSTIGRTFEELADLRARTLAIAPQPGRVGFCIDTCHMHAAGYDLSTRAKAEAALGELAERVGIEHVRVMHLNDSKGAAGSRLDRHEHIGAGTIGLEGFAAVVNHAALAKVPKIMETPKGPDPSGVEYDTVNLNRLRGLLVGTAARPPRPVKPSASAATPGVSSAAGQRARPAPSKTASQSGPQTRAGKGRTTKPAAKTAAQSGPSGATSARGSRTKRGKRA